MTSDIRTIRNIESMVGERHGGAHDSRELHAGSTEEWLIAQRTNLWEILRLLDVRDSRFTTSTFLNYLRGA